MIERRKMEVLIPIREKMLENQKYIKLGIQVVGCGVILASEALYWGDQLLQTARSAAEEQKERIRETWTENGAKVRRASGFLRDYSNNNTETQIDHNNPHRKVSLSEPDNIVGFTRNNWMSSSIRSRGRE